MIQVDNICMKYGKNLVLDNVSFQIKRGQIVGLLGVNGAGKSSIMNIITGYIRPTSGSVTIDGVNIEKKPVEAKKKIGYLPEIPPLYKDMKVWEYLVYAAKLKGIKDYKEEVERLISLFNLENKKYEFIKKLSKGMQQRVGFAYAIMGEPDVLVLDEPLVGLDPSESKNIRQIIMSFSKEHAIIISSHILKEIEELCSEIMILKDGKIVLDNSTSGAKRKNNQYSYRLTVKGKRDKVEECLKKNELIKQIEYITESEKDVHEFVIFTKNVRDVRDSLFGYLVGNKINVYEIKKQESSLEDVFMNMNDKEEK